MGYRSQGVVALDKELYDEFLMLQIKLPDIFKHMEFEPMDTHVLWEFDGFKMYTGYRDVDEMGDFFNFLKGSGPWEGMEECPERWANKFQYIRIGEDSEDTEDQGGEYWYTVERSIVRY